MMGTVMHFPVVQLNDPDNDPPMMARFIEVSTIELAEDGTGAWIQAFPYVEYDHPIWGKIKFNEERAQRMAANVAANVRGQDLDVDYDHKAQRGDAAGWIKKAEARSDGLYIFVEWTKEAFTKIKEKAYRYFSPEYTDKWKHPDGRVFQDVLWGGALTNRPFLKGITPINLSEMVGSGSEEVPPGSEGGNEVNREQLEKLAKNLKVEFTDETSDSDLYAAIEKASTQEEPETETETEEEETEEETSPELVSASLSELKKLAETNPAIKILLDEREAQEKRLVALEVSRRLSEVTVKLGELDTDTVALSAKAKDKLKATVIQLSDKAGDAVLDVVKDILDGSGIVEKGERGRTRNDDTVQLDDIASDFDKKVIKLMEGNDKLSIGDAVEQVARDHPELAEAHRRGSYANDELRGDR